MLDMHEKLSGLSPFQRHAMVLHAINLREGLECTGFQEDDPEHKGTQS
jgi:hypothetical protein